MKKTIVVTATTLFVWAVLFMPVWLPDRITGYIPRDAKMHEPFNAWCYALVVFMVAASFWQIDLWVSKLYDWIKRD